MSFGGGSWLCLGREMAFIMDVFLEKRDLAWSIADFAGFKDTQYMIAQYMIA